ncbi:MAG TPA: hypothetical protein VF814_19770 [Casimicrobiaceae bacterium]
MARKPHSVWQQSNSTTPDHEREINMQVPFLPEEAKRLSELYATLDQHFADLRRLRRAMSREKNEKACNRIMTEYETTFAAVSRCLAAIRKINRRARPPTMKDVERDLRRIAGRKDGP